MAISKVMINGVPIIDLTGVSVSSQNLGTGEIAHGSDGLACIGEQDVGNGVETAFLDRTISGTFTTDIDSLRRYVFAGCSQLDTINTTEVEALPSNVASSASTKKLIAPKNKTSNSYMFDGNTNLLAFALRNGNTNAGADNIAQGCTSLAAWDVKTNEGRWDNTNIGGRFSVFYKCAQLKTLILRNTTKLNTLQGGYASTFLESPFANGGSGGTIYIPKVLYDHLGDGTELDYKSATNWSTLDSYGTITWAKIEGTGYEFYRADNTPLDNVVPEWEVGAIDQTTGEYVESDSAIRLISMRIKPTSYSQPYNLENNSPIGGRVYFYKEDGTFVSSANFSASSTMNLVVAAGNPDATKYSISLNGSDFLGNGHLVAFA